MQDEIRLLQHVLNCPGIGEWGSHVIYFSDEWFVLLSSSPFYLPFPPLWLYSLLPHARNYKQAEHFYNMLTKFLSPWPISPPNFLTDFGQEALISEAEKTKQILLSNNISPSTGVFMHCDVVSCGVWYGVWCVGDVLRVLRAHFNVL